MVNIWGNKPGKKSELLLSPIMKVGGYDHPELPISFSATDDAIAYASWGLIPAWAKAFAEADKLRKQTLNARSETMFEKPAFRQAAHQRCLVWINGFYEWQHVGKAKRPFFIHTASPLMALGGLVSDWLDPATGATLRTCTVVTTEANALMSEIHNSKLRMPLILQPDAWASWLNSSATEAEVMRICQPLPEGILQAEDLTPPPAEVDEKGQMALF